MEDEKVKQPDPAGPREPLALWKILLLAFIAVTAFQGTRGLYESTEGRYAECAREMLVTGGFLEPTLEFLPHWTKPPLAYWGIAGGMALFGQNNWGARAYLIVAFCFTVLAVYRLAQHLWGKDPAPYCALVYATAPFPLGAANTVNADTLLALWEALALWGFWAGVRQGEAAGFRLMWLFLGAGFLTKGPPGLIPLVSVLPLHRLMRKRLPRRSPSLFRISGLLLFSVVGLAWYCYEITVHEGLLPYWIEDEVLGRFATEEFRRNFQWYKPITVYLPFLILGGLPWLALVVRHYRSIPWPGARWREPEYWVDRVEWLFLCLSFCGPFFIFSLSNSRLPLYVLPLFVPLSLALGRAIHWLVENGRVSHSRVTGMGLATVLLVMALKAAIACWPSPRNMGQLLDKIEAAVPGAHGGGLYLVDDEPLYGLQFYLKESFTRAAGEPRFRKSSSIISVSDLPARIGGECSDGGVPLLLVPRGQLERIREIFPPEPGGEARQPVETAPGKEAAPRSKGRKSRQTAERTRAVSYNFEVRELDPEWALVLPCGGSG